MPETDLMKQLLDFQFWEAITGVFTESAGGAVVIVLVIGGIFAAQYQTQGSPVIPIITLFLVGGAAVVGAPTIIIKAVVGVTTITLALVSYVAYQRTRRGGYR